MLKKALLAATALGILTNVTVAQTVSLPIVVVRPGTQPVPADGCGGFGSSVIRWAEETAAEFIKMILRLRVLKMHVSR
jgi:hypothetical protein